MTSSRSIKEKEKNSSEVETKTTTAGYKKNPTTNDSTLNDALNIKPKELFDSSKYDAMSDMTQGANQKTESIEVLANPHQAERLKSEEIPSKA